MSDAPDSDPDDASVGVGEQLATWTIEAMAEPDLLTTTDPLEPRNRRLVRDAVRALRAAPAR